MRAAICGTTLCTLLALATSASAECAWVLWRQGSQSESKATSRTYQWDVVSAHPTAALCEPARTRALKQTAELFKGDAPNVAHSFTSSEPDSVYVLLKNGAIYTYAFLCLPDSVDPRGPKGK